MENLAIVVESLTNANKALRKVLERDAGKKGQMEKFEEQFCEVKKNFSQFRELVIKTNKQSDELQARLHQDIENYKHNRESLRSEILNLDRQIQDQCKENSQLERELKENVEKLQKLKYSSNELNTNGYANSPQQRLQNGFG